MTKKRIAFIFPGQGAQKVGMGKDFAEAFATARETFQHGDEILERSLSRIVFEGPDDELMKTRNSQTGIYLTSMALFNVLCEQIPQLTPLVCAGHSLGEYSALTAAKNLGFEDCLPLVQWRGQVMNDACQQQKGAMAAVMGLSASNVEALVAELDLPNDLWVANFNCPGQVVISGTEKGIEAAAVKAKEAGAKRVIPLPVHGAFHSGLMQEAEERLKPQIDAAAFVDSSVPVVMNVSAQKAESVEDIRRNLSRQVTGSVRWEQSVATMDAMGIDLFVEVGPGKTLSGLNKRIGVTAQTINVEKPTDLDKLVEALDTALL